MFPFATDCGVDEVPYVFVGPDSNQTLVVPDIALMTDCDDVVAPGGAKTSADNPPLPIPYVDTTGIEVPVKGPWAIT